MVILGTQYAGEMKKGVLTLMMYRMPLLGQLCLHSSANADAASGDVSVFFGLSGCAIPRRSRTYCLLLCDPRHRPTAEPQTRSMLVHHQIQQPCPSH